MKWNVLNNKAVAFAILSICSSLTSAQDLQVNSKDNNAPTLGNFTTESETSAAKHGSLVVVGYNTSRQAGVEGAGAITSLSGYAYSTDTGTSFLDGGFVPASGSFVLEGDPTLAFDRSGNLYYGSLMEDIQTNCSYIGISKSLSASVPISFGPPIPISGPSSCSGRAFEDKEFLAIDTSGGRFDGRVYVAWSEFPDPQVLTAQALFAASSSISPLTFGPTLALAPSADPFQHGTFPIVGSDGVVYVAWSALTSISSAASASIKLVKSTDGGSTFGNLVTVATFTSTAGDLGSNGMSLRTRSFPYLAVDSTPVGSPTHNNLYAVFQAQPGSSALPRSEVFFTLSKDGGSTWSTPKMVSSGSAVTVGGDSTTNDNWLPSISVSPTTGHIEVLFYSRREDPLNQKIRVYEARSTDGGQTWSNEPFSSLSFVPSVGYDTLLVANYMGDYLYSFADTDGFFGVWGDSRNLCSPPAAATAPCSPAGRGDQDVWFRQTSDPTNQNAARFMMSAKNNLPTTEGLQEATQSRAFQQTSRQTTKPIPQQSEEPRTFALTVQVQPSRAHEAVLHYLTSRAIKIIQDNSEKLTISSDAIPLSHDELLQSVTPSSQRLVTDNVKGKYFVTFKTNAVGGAAAAQSRVAVSTRIIILTSQDLDSPLGGRIAASNGTIEQKYMSALAAQFQ